MCCVSACCDRARTALQEAFLIPQQYCPQTTLKTHPETVKNRGGTEHHPYFADQVYSNGSSGSHQSQLRLSVILIHLDKLIFRGHEGFDQIRIEVRA